jgi:hypothetical protein
MYGGIRRLQAKKCKAVEALHFLRIIAEIGIPI